MGKVAYCLQAQSITRMSLLCISSQEQLGPSPKVKEQFYTILKYDSNLYCKSDPHPIYEADGICQCFYAEMDN